MRILSHQYRREGLERADGCRAGLEPVMLIVAHLERPDGCPGPPPVPEEVALLQREERMPAALERAHHRHAGVLVGLERGERVEDEGEFHGGRMACASAIVPHRRTRP